MKPIGLLVYLETTRMLDEISSRIIDNTLNPYLCMAVCHKIVMVRNKKYFVPISIIALRVIFI